MNDPFGLLGGTIPQAGAAVITPEPTIPAGSSYLLQIRFNNEVPSYILGELPLQLLEPVFQVGTPTLAGGGTTIQVPVQTRKTGGLSSLAADAANVLGSLLAALKALFGLLFGGIAGATFISVGGPQLFAKTVAGGLGLTATATKEANSLPSPVPLILALAIGYFVIKEL